MGVLDLFQRYYQDSSRNTRIVATGFYHDRSKRVQDNTNIIIIINKEILGLRRIIFNKIANKIPVL